MLSRRVAAATARTAQQSLRPQTLIPRAQFSIAQRLQASEDSRPASAVKDEEFMVHFLFGQHNTVLTLVVGGRRMDQST